jgi:NADH:ubiquinone reductase (H+-translocating)
VRARSNTGRRAVLRNQLVRMLEEAEAESDPENRGRLLTFVVAGGGFSGIECIAEMNDFLREAICAYHNITEDDLRLILLQRGERILPELTPSLAAFAHKLLENRSIEIRLGAGLKAVTANAVLVEEKQTRRTETSRPAPLWPPSPRALIRFSRRCHRRKTKAESSSTRLRKSPIGRESGRSGIAQRSAKSTETSLLPRHSTPCAKPRLARKISSPPTEITPKKKFDFTGLGKLRSLGKRSAVAEILGFRLKGTDRLAAVAWCVRNQISWPGWPTPLDRRLGA